MSNIASSVAIRMNTEFSPRAFPGHILGIVQVCELLNAQLGAKGAHRRAKPNAHDVGSIGTSPVVSRKRSGTNSYGSYGPTLANAIDLTPS